MNKELCDTLDKFAEHLKNKEELKTLPTCLTEERLFEIVEMAVRKVLVEKERKESMADTVHRLESTRTFNHFK